MITIGTMRTRIVLIGVLSVGCSLTPAQTTCPAFTPLHVAHKISPTDQVFSFDGGVVALTREMPVDTDGSPFSYEPRNGGTSDLCDGLDPYDATGNKCEGDDKSASSVCERKVHDAMTANWDRTSSGPFCIYGFDAPGSPKKIDGSDNNVWGSQFGNGPIPVQGKDDPAPGFFISSTAFANPEFPHPGTQRHYIDAGTTPYLVVPGGMIGKHKILPLGPSPAWAWNLRTQHDSPAVTGDSQNKFGEGSAALAQALESGQITPIKMDQVLHPNSNKPPFPYVVKAKAGHTRAAGATGPFILVYFSHQPALRNLDSKAIGAEVDAAFQPYGGKIAFKACLLKLQ